MKIRNGLQNGAVLQRDAKNNCHVVLTGQWKGPVSSSAGKVLPADDGSCILTGIPAGGPYTITLEDADSRCTFTDIYVGDVWLLAGQSNMEGAGRMRAADYAYDNTSVQAVRAMYMDDHWAYARPQLHQLWLSRDPAHVQTHTVNMAGRAASGVRVLDDPPAVSLRGVGPGFYFARTLYEITGIPQGVIPCAVGGAPIAMWTPPADETENYYTAALRRIVLCGRNIRGLFWYQGEGYSGDLADYSRRFTAMRDGFASCCSKTVLPAVQVQTFRCFLPGYRKTEAVWSRFRAFQREMSTFLPSLITLASNDLDLDDLIHLSADAQEKLGKRAADAMLYLLEGRGCGEPDIESVTAEEDVCVAGWTLLCIRYRNIRGSLQAAGVPDGFTLSEGENPPSRESIQNIRVRENTVCIRCELSREQLRRKALWYGFGHDFHCNITDSADHAIPAMGPVSLADYI